MNYLGLFASIADVWHFFPEGGMENDYVRIGDDTYQWNASSRTWDEFEIPVQQETPMMAAAAPVLTSVGDSASNAGQYNYLGSFASNAAVWQAFPEGGIEGDYVHIASVVKVWNVSQREWGDNSDPSSRAITGQTIDGSLTINYHLTVGGELRIGANSLKVTGGASSMFVKGDGSLDTNSYVTPASLATSLEGYATTMNAVTNTGIVLKHGSTVLATISVAELQSLVGTGGGGSGATNLRQLTDVYHGANTVYRADGSNVQNGDSLVYDATNLRWHAAAVQGGGGGSSQLESVIGIDNNGDVYIKKKTVDNVEVARNFYCYGGVTAGGNGSGGSGGGSASWGTGANGVQVLRVGSGSDNERSLLLYDSSATTGHYLQKTATGVTWAAAGGAIGNADVKLNGYALNFDSNLDKTMAAFKDGNLLWISNQSGSIRIQASPDVSGAKVYIGAAGFGGGNLEVFGTADIRGAARFYGNVQIDGNLTVTGTYPQSQVSYSDLSGKPSINSVSLSGNNNGAHYGLLDLSGGTLTGQLTARAILPSATKTYALGSSSAIWSSLHVQSMSLNDGSHVATFSVTEDASNVVWASLSTNLSVGNLALGNTNGTYLKIGNLKMVYDSTTNTLSLVHITSGQVANFKASGQITAGA